MRYLSKRVYPFTAMLLMLSLVGCEGTTDKSSSARGRSAHSGSNEAPSDKESAAANAKPTDTTGMKVVTTKSGLKYVDLKEGEGEPVHEGDSVLVHYTGWLTNGTKFDSSVDRGTPFWVENVGKAQVIPGWNEGLIGMKKGGKRQLIIPSKLAYGKNSPGPKIPADADLIFDIEVLRITR